MSANLRKGKEAWAYQGHVRSVACTQYGRALPVHGRVYGRALHH